MNIYPRHLFEFVTMICSRTKILTRCRSWLSNFLIFYHNKCKLSILGFGEQCVWRYLWTIWAYSRVPKGNACPLLVEHRFMYDDRPVGRCFSCLTLPHSSEVYMRLIINHRYRIGFEESVTSVIAKYLVDGISSYHTKSRPHGFFHAGSMYVYKKIEGSITIQFKIEPGIYKEDCNCGGEVPNIIWKQPNKA